MIPLISNQGDVKKVLRVIKCVVAWAREQTSFPSLEVSSSHLNKQHGPHEKERK
jgi:hypothetical protein